MPNRNRDRELRLTRVLARHRRESVFIDTNAIIRGALLAEDLSSRGAEHLVVNFIDQDMWMRMQSIDLVTNANI
jgi:hypothetical protein